MGRYFVYGVFSLGLIYQARRKGGCRYPFRVWLKSLHYSLIITVGYYTCLVLGLRYSTPAICALIIGLSPIVIAFYGNWKQKEVSFRSLIAPSILILIGLGMINGPNLQSSDTPTTFIWGLFFSTLSLIGWSWYVVANARYLKNNPQVDSGDWNNLQGTTSIFWVVLIGLFVQDHIHFDQYLHWSPDLQSFIIGCSVLGIFCSSVATALWNKASIHLPVSLAGQLTLFETIFGVLFYYILIGQLPPLMESAGIALFLFAITLGVRRQTVSVA